MLRPHGRRLTLIKPPVVDRALSATPCSHGNLARVLIATGYTRPRLAVDLKLVTARAAPARPAGDACKLDIRKELS